MSTIRFHIEHIFSRRKPSQAAVELYDSRDLGPWRLRFRNHHARVSRRPMPQCLTLDPALVDCREKRTERGSGASPRNPIVEDMLEVVTRVK